MLTDFAPFIQQTEEVRSRVLRFRTSRSPERTLRRWRRGERHRIFFDTNFYGSVLEENAYENEPPHPSVHESDRVVSPALSWKQDIGSRKSVGEILPKSLGVCEVRKLPADLLHDLLDDLESVFFEITLLS